MFSFVGGLSGAAYQAAKEAKETAENNQGGGVIGGDGQMLVNVPTQRNDITYNGDEQSPTFNGYNTHLMALGGVTKGTDAGEYDAIFTLNDTVNYKWTDGTTAPKTVKWIIGKGAGSVSLSPASLEFAVGGTRTISVSRLGNGAVTVQSSNPDIVSASVSNDGSTVTVLALAVGNASIIVNVAAGDNHLATSEVCAVSVVAKTAVPLPTVASIPTYNGSPQSPTFNNYDSNLMTLGGDTSGTNAGNYNAVFTLKDPTQHMWPDDNVNATATVSWSIAKAAGSLSLDKSALALNSAGATDTITVTRAGDGAVSAVSSDTSKATVSVSGTTVTVTAVAEGSATITVSVAEGTNHNAPANNATCAVSLSFIPANLEDATLDQIGALATAGLLGNYFKEGDAIGVNVNGKCGPNCTLNNVSLKAFILGFNHNSAKEGNGLTHFCLGKNADGTDICLYYAQMNPSNTNAGGWKDSPMRTTYLGQNPSSPPADSLMAALPAALRALLKPVTKWTDNAGGNQDNAASMSSTTDYLFLLSEWEVHGAKTYANSAEQNYQKQYEYFKKGNSKVAYRHDSTSSAINWWCRSPRASYTNGFCGVNGYGSAHINYAHNYYGVRAGFCI